MNYICDLVFSNKYAKEKNILNSEYNAKNFYYIFSDIPLYIKTVCITDGLSKPNSDKK